MKKIKRFYKGRFPERYKIKKDQIGGLLPEILQAVREGATIKEVRGILKVGDNFIRDFRREHYQQWLEAKQEWKFNYSRLVNIGTKKQKTYSDYLNSGRR